MEQEGKVIYSEGGQVRAVRGQVYLDGDFIRVERRGGRVLISRKNVISIRGLQGAKGAGP